LKFYVSTLWKFFILTLQLTLSHSNFYLCFFLQFLIFFPLLSFLLLLWLFALSNYVILCSTIWHLTIFIWRCAFTIASFFSRFCFSTLLQFCIVNVFLFWMFVFCYLFVIHTFLMYFLFCINCWLCCKSQIVMDDQVFILLMILIMLVINMVQKTFIEANLMSLICYEANNIISPKQISKYM
jgi:hypothetical protein